MVDISGKVITARTAVAESNVRLSEAALAALLEGNNKKGDVLAVARVAGIQASKLTSQLIPLCHPIPLTNVSIEFTINRSDKQLIICATCQTQGITGVEMEALTAASVAALTIYDMCKALDKGIEISATRLLKKTGGKSGDWIRGETELANTELDNRESGKAP